MQVIEAEINGIPVRILRYNTKASGVKDGMLILDLGIDVSEVSLGAENTITFKIQGQ